VISPDGILISLKFSFCKNLMLGISKAVDSIFILLILQHSKSLKVPYEIIVVEDGSVDKTLDIISKVGNLI